MIKKSILPTYLGIINFIIDNNLCEEEIYSFLYTLKEDVKRIDFAGTGYIYLSASVIFPLIDIYCGGKKND